MEETIRKFRILNGNKEFLGAAPEPEKLTWTMKLLTQIRRDYQYDLLADGLARDVSAYCRWQGIYLDNQWCCRWSTSPLFKK